MRNTIIGTVQQIPILKYQTQILHEYRAIVEDSHSLFTKQQSAFIHSIHGARFQTEFLIIIVKKLTSEAGWLWLVKKHISIAITKY